MLRRLAQLRPAWLLALIVVVSSGATLLAMRRTSTTFDEIVLMAAGARGYATGKWDLAPEHPPLTQYLYGLPVYLTRPHYPQEPTTGVSHQQRYQYARLFFWQSGNDAERLTFLGRLPAVFVTMLLILAAYAFTRRAVGLGAGLTAATLVAFLPDVLAHGGVAYNDIPLTLTYFLAVWAIDLMVRAPTLKHAVAAGAAVGLTLGVKISAVAIGPAAVLLLLVEAVRRGRDVRWIVRMAPAIAICMVAAYLALVIIYRGDFTLQEFRYALVFTFQHITSGHGAAAFLLGHSSPKGFWYFYPVAFLFKTPVGLHILGLLALVALLKADYPGWRELLAHPLRVPVVAAAVFGGLLLTSSLNIGFRHALPILPHVCILIAAGVAYMWRTSDVRVRATSVVSVAWLIVSSLSYYPNFLAYISEYGPGRDRGSEVLIDSSLDWGQGLLQLRDYMRAHNIDRVYLSYFGSARPDGYGIDYVPLYSFGPLERSTISPPNAPQPRYVVISATNLQGAYFLGDPFGKFRSIEPAAVVAHTMYIYRIRQ